MVEMINGPTLFKCNQHQSLSIPAFVSQIYKKELNTSIVRQTHVSTHIT